jgi:hypothetical protein
VRAKMAAALKGVFIVQSLCISRLKWWWDVGAKIETGQNIGQLKKQAGLLKQVEVSLNSGCSQGSPVSKSSRSLCSLSSSRHLLCRCPLSCPFCS